MTKLKASPQLELRLEWDPTRDIADSEGIEIVATIKGDTSLRKEYGLRDRYTGSIRSNNHASAQQYAESMVAEIITAVLGEGNHALQTYNHPELHGMTLQRPVYDQEDVHGQNPEIYAHSKVTLPLINVADPELVVGLLEKVQRHYQAKRREIPSDPWTMSYSAHVLPIQEELHK